MRSIFRNLIKLRPNIRKIHGLMGMDESILPVYINQLPY